MLGRGLWTRSIACCLMAAAAVALAGCEDGSGGSGTPDIPLPGGGIPGGTPVTGVVLRADPNRVGAGQTTIRITPRAPVSGFRFTGAARVERSITSIAGFDASFNVTSRADQELTGTLDVTVPESAASSLSVPITLRITYTVAGVEQQGDVLIFFTREASTPCAVIQQNQAAVEADLREKLRQATMAIDRRDRRLYTRVPLVPFAPQVSVPIDGGRLPITLPQIPLPLRVPSVPVAPVEFRFTWRVGGARVLASTPTGQPIALDQPSSEPTVVMRAVPDPRRADAAGARVTVELSASIPLCNIRVTVPEVVPPPETIPATLDVPRVLALYRFPDMRAHPPVWRRRNVRQPHNSGLVLFGPPESFRLPEPNLGLLLPGVRLPETLRELDGLGTLLQEINGPIATPLGPAGLAQELPALEALPDELRRPLRMLDALRQSIVLLSSSAAEIAAINPGRGNYVRIVRDTVAEELGQINFIDGEPGICCPVHVQDEAEAAIVLGLPRTAAELFVLPKFDEVFEGIGLARRGVGRLEVPSDGYVATIPDLAMAGPQAADEDPRGCVKGWLPNNFATNYDEGHPRTPDPDSDRFGWLKIRVSIIPDRSIGTDPPDAETERSENERRDTSISRSASSLRLLPTADPLGCR